MSSRTKNWIIGLFTIAVIVLLGVIFAPTLEETGNSLSDLPHPPGSFFYTKYSDPSGLFTFEYPNYWKGLDNPGGPDLLADSTTTPTPSVGLGIRCSVGTVSHCDDFSLQTRSGETLAQALTQFQSAGNAGEKSAVTVGGEAGYEFYRPDTTTVTTGNGATESSVTTSVTTYEYTVIIPHGGMVYTLSYRTDSMVQFPEFKHILASFTFLK